MGRNAIPEYDYGGILNFMCFQSGINDVDNETMTPTKTYCAFHYEQVLQAFPTFLICFFVARYAIVSTAY